MIDPITRSAILVDAITAAEPVTLAYDDADGVASIRTVTPSTVWRCQNGNTVVTGFDHARQEPRCFNVGRILDIVPGVGVALVTLI